MDERKLFFKYIKEKGFEEEYDSIPIMDKKRYYELITSTLGFRKYILHSSIDELRKELKLFVKTL